MKDRPTFAVSSCSFGRHSLSAWRACLTSSSTVPGIQYIKGGSSLILYYKYVLKSLTIRKGVQMLLKIRPGRLHERENDYRKSHKFRVKNISCNKFSC